MRAAFRLMVSERSGGAGRGASSTSMRPCRRQPIVASHVRAAGSDGGVVDAWGRLRHPSNQSALERGSNPRANATCLRQLFSTYTSAFRTSRGVRSRRAWYRSPHTATSERAVHGLRDARSGPLHAAHEARRLVRLHQQMQMIGLNAELQNAKVRSGCSDERRTNRLVRSRRAQGRQPRRCTQRHVCRTSRNVRVAATVRNGATALRGLASGAWSWAAPCTEHQGQLGIAAHLD